MKKLVYFSLIALASCDSNAKVNQHTECNGCVIRQSELICPYCSHKEIETMPTDYCLVVYNCKECKTEMNVKPGDCCVFCSYGSHKCPPIQITSQLWPVFRFGVHDTQKPGKLLHTY